MTFEFIKKLKEKEPEAVVSTIALMAYNPSIGRVLERGGVKKFQKMALSFSQKLPQIRSKDGFNKFHREWVEKIRKEIKTNKGFICSYGQAQKAINVFLKLYVDWSHLPNAKTAKRILPFLHVPLDSLLMGAIKKEFPREYQQMVLPIYRKNKIKFTLSLSKMSQHEIYFSWQELLRKIHPQKPLLLDVAWYINREK